MTALSLSAVGCLWGKSAIAFSANHLVALEFPGEGSKRWFNLELSHAHATSKSEDEMESGLFLDVVIGESSSVFKLLTSEDESLLIWRDTFFVLNFSLNIFNCVSGLDIKSNRLTGEGFDKYLHF